MGNLRYNHVIVFSGLIAVLGSLGFARFGCSMILPGMKEGLSLTYTQTGVMESANFIGYMVFAILGGVLASRYGPRIVIALSLALTGMSMVFTGLTNSFLQALILRGLTGIGSGGANVPAMMLPAIWISSSKRGFASGVIAAGSGVGLIFTGFLVPQFNAQFGVLGWRYSWLILGVITLCFASICSFTVKNPPIKDELGEHESLEGSLLRVPLVWKMGVTYLMFGLSYIIYVTFFGAYLVNEVGLTPPVAGSLWALVGFLSLVSGPLWGHISDRLGRRYGLSIVYFIHSFSFLLFSLRGEPAALNISAILFGVTAWSIPSIIAAYSGDVFGPKKAFSVMGFLTLFFGVGQAIGPTIAGFIADYSQTFTLAFLLSSIAAVCGGFLSLKILRKDR